MPDDPWRTARLTGVIGVLGFVVPVLATVLLAPTWDVPATGSDAEVFAAHLADQGQAMRAGVVLDAVGVTLWGMFGVGVWQFLRGRTGGESLFSACFLLGVVSMITMLLAGFTAALPRWTATLAVVGAVAHVLLLASFLVDDGFLSLEGQVITVIPATLFVWILGTAVALLRLPRDAAA